MNPLMVFLGIIFLCFRIAFFLLNLAVGIIFVADVVTLLKGPIGFIANVAWIIVAPLMSPAVLGLPWFDAWVCNCPVNDRIFWIWGTWVTSVLLVWTASLIQRKYMNR